MATVPIYDSKVQPGQMPGTTPGQRYTPTDFGGGVGAALTEDAQVASQISIQKKNDVNAARLMNAYAELGNERIDLEKAVQDIHGAPAVEQDLPAIARDRLKKKADEIAATLPEELQTQFRQIYLKDDEGIHRVAREHFVKEDDAYADASHRAVVEVSAAKAADAAQRVASAPPVPLAATPGLGIDLTPPELGVDLTEPKLGVDLSAEPTSGVATNPDVLAARKAILDANAHRTGRKGWAGTVMEEASRRADLSAMHVAVLDRLTDMDKGGSAQQAQGYLNQWGYEIDPKERSRFTKVVEAAGLKDRGRTTADQLLATAGGDVNEAVKLARGITDTNLFDEVDKRLKARASEDHQLEVLADAPREGRLEQTISRAGTLDRLSPDFTKLSDHGRARVEEKFKAAQRADKNASAEDRRAQVEVDKFLDAAFTGSLPMTGVPGADQASIDIDHSDYFAHASPTAREILKGKQKKVVAEIAKDGGVSRQAFLDKVADVSKRLGHDKKTAAEFHSAMLDQRNAWEEDPKNGGKHMPPAEMNRLFAEAIVYGDPNSSSGSWGSNLYAWQKGRSGHASTFYAFPDNFQPGPVKEVLKTLLGPVTPPAPGAAPAALPPVPAGGTPHDLTKPILLNPDGSWSTESTITVKGGGKHYVIPTIVAGKRVTNEKAIELLKAKINLPVGTFDTAAAAEAYAQQRHLEEERLRAPDVAAARAKAAPPQPKLPFATKVSDIPPARRTALLESWAKKHPKQPPPSDDLLLMRYNQGLTRGEK